MSQPDNVVPLGGATNNAVPPDGGALAPDGGAGGADGAKKPPRKKREQKIDFTVYNRLLEHFALIYGTDTAWDGESERIVKINALRLAFGHDTVKVWLASVGRRMILPEQLMFEPGRNLPEPCINLFTGFELSPSPGDVAPILELAHHLVMDSAPSDTGVDEVLTWVLRWLALPLQRPGTKMRTALVVHGPQGAGKNLFFEIMCKIYGAHALVVGQDQLEDKFNDWASQKLFLIGDEVVARAELYHQKNKLKAFITGDTIQINAKMLPLRTEANHVNVVFLSNEPQPLALEDDDRRYCVIYTPPRRVDDLYQRVASCVAMGGAQAFMDYLLALDMGDFSEFTLPPMTTAKQDLIELGRRPHERFIAEWLAEELPLPVNVCGVGQLYKAFQRWCGMVGERFPPSQIVFTKRIKQITQGRLRLKKVKLDHQDRGKSVESVWIPGACEAPPGRTEGSWAQECVEAFGKALGQFHGGFQQGDQE